MSVHLGTVPAGSTIYIPFATYGGTDGESITCTGLAVTDIEIYKNGSITQRASDSGYTLLDTDGIDFDGLTGIHGFSIDLSDDTDSGFYSVGAFYWVVVSSVTVDSQTVNFVAATFRVGPAEGQAGYPKVDTQYIEGTDATDQINAACDAALSDINLDHLMKTGDATLTNIVEDNTALAHLMASGADISDYSNATDSLEALRDHIGDGTNLTEAGGDGDHLSALPAATIRNAVIADGDGTEIDAAALNTFTGITNLSSLSIDADGYVRSDLKKINGVAASVASGVELADDAITAAKFDESTAYPLTSADTGATAVARTGADSDTLETLSDQIDGVYTGTPPTAETISSQVASDLATAHGAGSWETAAGFSTHSAADVVAALGTGATLTACATATGFSTHSANDVVTALGHW